MSPHSGRLVRNPELLVSWQNGRLFIENLPGRRGISTTLLILGLLDSFGRPLRISDASHLLPGVAASDVRRAIVKLRRLGFLVSPEKAARQFSRLEAWKENLASALYHAACRDARYVSGGPALDILLRKTLAADRPPPRFKRYITATALPLSSQSPAVTPLEGVLRARRTVRTFSRRPVAFENLASIVRGTWGQTGWIDGGPLGKLVAKTSPSAGSLHPIECYVLAWNVRGLPKGLYHFDVKGGALRLLRRGDFRRAAVRAASGQRWVGKAAFLCIMTAVFARTLWKYGFEGAYRVLWMDAGHLAQTFALLATARGLGPFQTAAIQDSYIEKLIGLDGVKEFPVYLCGAGVPRGSPGTARARSR